MEGRKKKEPDYSTRFGGANANPRGDQSVAGKMRAFYRWTMMEATEDELKAFVKDKSKPISQRKFVDVLMHSDSVKDYLRVSEQFTGKPKQLIEMGDNAVTVNLVRGKND